MKKIKVDAFQTSDGEQFDNEVDAMKHETILENAPAIERYIATIENKRTKATIQRHIEAYLLLAVESNEAESEVVVSE